ncbi:MAG: putative toxin-antitoxin system toxin component, PIN family [Anaerolineae bacterium]|jgi:predicted nucleic acid-binding protein
MANPDLFFDSSALVSGIISAQGAARALLLMAEARVLAITVSTQVIAESERAIARVAPHALVAFREAVRSSGLQIVPDPTLEEVQAHLNVIAHPADVPIVVAAMQARVDYLVTLNRRHFIDDPAVSARSGVRIGSPGDALAWVREQIAGA